MQKISVKLLTKYIIIIYALGLVHEKFGVRIKATAKLLQSCSKGEIPGRARLKEWLGHSKLRQAFLIDSDDNFFMNLIQCIRFGWWKVQHLKFSFVHKIVFHLHGFVSVTQLKIRWWKKIMLYVKNNTMLLKIMNEKN